MVVGMGVSFQYPMGMGMDMGVLFENRYGCRYSSTRSIVIHILEAIPGNCSRASRRLGHLCTSYSHG